MQIQILIELNCHFNGHFWLIALNMNIYKFRGSRQIRIDIFFRIHVTSGFNGFFNGHIRPEDDDVERWVSIPNLEIRQSLHTPNFKNSEQKLWS